MADKHMQQQQKTKKKEPKRVDKKRISTSIMLLSIVA